MLIPIIISSLIGYLMGSIPFALVIGKLFYKTDIREHGSKNPGGSNAGRVLGKRAGLAVMTLDILKVTLAMLLSSLLFQGNVPLSAAGISCALGHCFPIFASFKGGKAVATMYGFLFGMIVVGKESPLLFLIPLCAFLLIIFATKIVAISSIGSALTVLIYSVIFEDSILLAVSLLFFVVLMIIRHTSNIKRILRGEENKVKWIR